MSMFRPLLILILSIFCFSTNAADLITLSGTAVDAATHEPLPFATVSVSHPGGKSAPLSMHTDANGHWSMRVVPGKTDISVTYIGYKPFHSYLTLSADRRLTARSHLPTIPSARW